MPGKPSAIGFGFQSFGDHPFGSADWAEEVTFRITPIAVQEDDAKCEFDPAEPYRKLINSYKPAIQEVKDRYEQFPDLWDANQVPIAQLRNLGFNFNILLSSLQEIVDQTVTTVGDTAATVDLSTFPIQNVSAINPGTVRLTLEVDGISTYVVRDNSEGSFPVSSALPAGATVDYETGTLSGVTAPLVAGSTITATYFNSAKDEDLHRSEVLNAIQFFLNKGIDKGYQIAAAFDGLLVVITPQWAENCDPGAALTTTGPTQFFPTFATFPADSIPADSLFSDFYETWPNALTWDDPCRTSFLELFFSTPDDTEIENFSVVAENILENLERVRPIHVRLQRCKLPISIDVGGPFVLAETITGDTSEATARVIGIETSALVVEAVVGTFTVNEKITGSVSGTVATVTSRLQKVGVSFDGPRASGGGWTIPVVAENSATAGGWTVPVTGELRATAGGWTIPLIGIP